MQSKWWTLIGVCVGVFMILLDVTIVNVALPDIQTHFTATLTDLQWVIDAYVLTLAAFLLTGGTVADLVGRRIVFAYGLVIFTLASLLCGLANGVLMLSLSRALQGVGGAIMFATSLALLAAAFPPKERGIAFGAFGGITGVALAIGPVLGGALTSGLSWRWIFLVNLPVGIAALLITVFGMTESRDPAQRRVDVPGAITFSAALALLVFGLIRSHPDGWGSVVVLGSLIGAAVLLVAFFVIESRSATPMFDLSLFRVPSFNGGLLAAWGISASLFSLFTFIAIYLQGAMQYSAFEVGLWFLPMTVVIFLTAGLAGWLSNMVPSGLLIAGGFVLVAVGLWLMRGSDPAGSWTHFLPGFVAAGAGAGLLNVPLAAVAVGVVAPERAGMASGINSTSRQVGIAIGVAALGSLLAARIQDSVRSSLSEGPLAEHADRFAMAASKGQAGTALQSLPEQQRGLAAQTAAQGYSTALDEILAVGAGIAIIVAVLTAVLIRQRDFVAGPEVDAEEPKPA
ncbi:MFS transporter [Nocardia iowensis]|uniref:DHA2 family efflux MFS transporter permease subunit n=1 Tax=Nocardia iowensis TaxID=204891 RepID=A0ABX8RFQ0_NOCIO|nr:MFS transporter [Nocardia iowensis]QXN88432.1 DHA2 family efflux MFS transporter permease subunit [Nocardia iowensis]